MKLKHAAVTMIAGALLTFPAGAHAGGRGGGDSAQARNGLDVRVNADNSGRGSTDVDVRKTKLAQTDTRAVQITATPDANQPIGPLNISVNAQVAVVQVVLRTNDVTVLDNVNVDVAQGAATTDPGAGTPPPTGGGGTTATTPGSPINISVNAQVAIVQIVVGTNNKVILKDINVNIAQGAPAV
jgi:hypothetical protein